MDPGTFIARRLSFQGRLATVSTAVSFLVMIIAVTVAAGFRNEIRGGLADLSGDVQLTGEAQNYYSDKAPVSSKPSYLDRIMKVEGVEEIKPVIYRAGIVKSGDAIHGVLFKGVAMPDSLSLQATIPERLSRLLGLGEGDSMLCYFIGEQVRARRFKVRQISAGLVETDDKLVVTVPIEDLRRLNGWEDDQVSALEVRLDRRYCQRELLIRKEAEIGSIVMLYAREDDPEFVATSTARKYPQVFDWLQLIDTNVLFILLLMSVVAGFNMISGLLILLFRHIRTIGTLKAMGMTDRQISGVFLRVASRSTLTGMAIGNAAALLFCLVQGTTHLIRLDSANYFVSFVPVSVNLPGILLADLAAWLIIMILLTLPCIFISRIDPAESVRMR